MGTPGILTDGQRENEGLLPYHCGCLNCERVTTPGNWATEDASLEAFDRLIQQTGAFRVFKQVRGQYVQNLPYKDHAEPRIDRVLMPTPETVSMGWTYGPVGVEAKKSGVKIGRPVAQMLDYRRALFNINNSGTWVHLSWVFLWPMSQIHSEFASVMAQSQVGGIAPHWKGGITIHSGQNAIATHTPDEGFRIRNCRIGKKVGSR